MVKKGIKLLKIVLMFFIIINILGINNTKVYAESSDFQQIQVDEGSGGDEEEKEKHESLSGEGMTDVSQNPAAWIPLGDSISTTFNDKINLIVGVVRIIGIMVSVVTLSIIGIKFMLGSVEEKAQYKQTLMPWLIGAILVFAITTIPSLIYDMSQGILE